MTRTNKIFIAISAAALFAVAALAQQSPSVDQILAHYVSALGGREALQKITSRHVKGTVEIDGIPGQGIAESYAKAPNKYVAIISFSGQGESRRGYDGSNGWASDSQGGFADLTGPDLASLVRAADMYQALDIQKTYPTLTAKGTEDIAGKSAFVVEGASPDGTTRTMYFDTASGLMLRSVENTMQGGEKTAMTIDYQEYQNVDGVKYPVKLLQRSESAQNPGISLKITLTEVHQNIPLDDSLFAKPTK